MYGNRLMGIQNPTPQMAQMGRETIGPQGEPYPPMTSQGMSQGISPSQGLFASYMSQLFNQKYRPPPMGGYQNFGMFGGFMPPNMPALQKPQAPAPSPGMMPGANNGMTWSDYLNAGG